jgi:hypothetical protein
VTKPMKSAIDARIWTKRGTGCSWLLNDYELAG